MTLIKFRIDVCESVTHLIRLLIDISDAVVFRLCFDFSWWKTVIHCSSICFLYICILYLYFVYRKNEDISEEKSDENLSESWCKMWSILIVTTEVYYNHVNSNLRLNACLSIFTYFSTYLRSRYLMKIRPFCKHLIYTFFLLFIYNFLDSKSNEKI